jgi:hypothetical protein
VAQCTGGVPPHDKVRVFKDLIGSKEKFPAAAGRSQHSRIVADTDPHAAARHLARCASNLLYDRFFEAWHCFQG